MPRSSGDGAASGVCVTTTRGRGSRSPAASGNMTRGRGNRSTTDERQHGRAAAERRSAPQHDGRGCDAGCLLAIATTPAACCLHPCLLAPAACILACLLRRLLARGSAASSFAFVLLLAGCLHSCISGCSGKPEPEPEMSGFVYFEQISG